MQVLLFCEVHVLAGINKLTIVGREAVVHVLVLFEVGMLALINELAVVSGDAVELVPSSVTV